MGRHSLMTPPGVGPMEWPPMEVDIPSTSPAAVGTPPFAGWLGLARANRAALDATTTEIAGIRLDDLRRAAREEILPLAAAYTRALGRDVPAFGSDLVIATGHQPVFVHPGIWIKYLAMARVVPAGGAGLNVIVDSDATDEIAAEGPRADGRLARARVTLAHPGQEVPAELLPSPTAEEWRTFAAAIDDHLSTITEPAIVEGWHRARAHLPPPTGEGLPGAVTAWRRALEGPRPYLDIPVSFLVRSRSFRWFASAILREPRRFASVHNACLVAYREHYGVRTPAQPFPDLEIDQEHVEAPFWYVGEGRRWPLFVNERTGRLVARGRDVGTLPSDPDDPAFASVPLRPRALTMTAFKRLVVADLFIHGIGGGRYDRATDAIVREFFGIAPPAYAIATATLFLPFRDAAPPDEGRHRLHRTLLDLQHNPDRFLSADSGPHRELVAEKWSLIRELEKSDGSTRRQRRAATQRIREINTILQVAVAGQIEAVQEALRHVDRRQEDAEVTGYRGYPFFLHRIESVEALVDLLR
ncbi:MAG: hypothetical protein ACT4PY_12025 [Armatimonadota bacterium]